MKMKKTASNRFTLAMLLLCAAPNVRADWCEDFDAYANGVSVTNLPGWITQDLGAAAFTVVTNLYAESGNVLMPYHNSTTGYWCERELFAEEVVPVYCAPLIIRFKWLCDYEVGRNIWLYFFDSANRTNGISVFISGGGTEDGAGWNSPANRDNEIRFSYGGESVFSPATTNLVRVNDGSYGESSRWLPGNWYQIEIGDITLSKTGEGTNVTAVVNMWHVGNGTQKIIDQPIVASGYGAGAFSKINAVRIAYLNNWGNRNYYFDDFEIFGTTPPKRSVIIVR